MPSAKAGDGEFSFMDQPGEHLDILLEGKLVGRYMYAHDSSTVERLHETYKPYLRVFAADGETPITKGPGGQFTHHRGIFIGWNKISFQGKSYDRWHMKGGEIVHQKFLKQQADARQASFTSLTFWNDNSSKPILAEERTLTFRRGSPPFRLIIDFQSVLKAEYGDIKLGGDPEHAGIQYRPANEVVKSETKYVFPQENADPKKELDYTWVGETYSLKGQRYSVVQMNHPANPKGTKYSAYRDYGRFGAFFATDIPQGKTLDVNYRFLVADGEMPPKSFIQKNWNDFAGQ